MSRSWKVTIIVLAGVGIVSTPLLWLLDGPNMGQLVGATVQAAVGIAALVWALLQPSSSRADDTAVGTGLAQAEGGGTAVTGVKRPGGDGSGSANADRTGNATASGEGSSAVSGIDYS